MNHTAVCCFKSNSLPHLNIWIHFFSKLKHPSIVSCYRRIELFVIHLQMTLLYCAIWISIGIIGWNGVFLTTTFVCLFLRIVSVFNITTRQSSSVLLFSKKCLLLLFLHSKKLLPFHLFPLLQTNLLPLKLK